MKKGWFGKNKDTDAIKNHAEDSESISDFEDLIDKSIVDKKSTSDPKMHIAKHKVMIRMLLKSGFSIEEINSLANSNKKYTLKDEEIIEEG